MNEIDEAIKEHKETMEVSKVTSDNLKETVQTLQFFMRVDDQNKSETVPLSQYISAETTSIDEHEGVRFIQRDNRYFMQYYSRQYGWRDVKLYV